MKKQRITVANGLLTCEYPTIGKKFQRRLADYSEAIYRQCFSADHGIRQKFGDAKSGQTPAEKYAEVLLIDASLMEGEWERTAAVDLTPKILEAVARIKGLRFDEEAGTLVEPKSKAVCQPTEDDIATWKSDPKVKAMRLKIAAERAEEAAEEADETEIVVRFAKP